MMTNTYKPIVGGIERSIDVASSQYREMGHKVLIVAPVFKNTPRHEDGVYRIPAIQNFNGTDFSVELPIPGVLNKVLDEFKPDIVHSHHPFLVGDTALRVSASYNVPIVFTYHTRYEMNTHYVPGDSRMLEKFVIELAAGYSDLCDQVIAPSESIKDILKKRAIKSRVDVIPTGIDVSEFAAGDGASFRKKLAIPEDAFLVGYLGRLAEEKNMLFLIKAVAAFMKNRKNAHFLIAGDGDLSEDLKDRAMSAGISDRAHFAGTVKGQDKIDAYHAMDVFVFASKSETQGIVLTEAMASGVPVIGVDAPGVREVIEDGINGRLLMKEDSGLFSGALETFYGMSDAGKEEFKKNAIMTAGKFDRESSIQKTLALYEKCIDTKHVDKDAQKSIWESAKRAIEKECQIMLNVVKSAGAALSTKGKEDGDEKP
jgi:1,2-diacylglycerol 3-alpha-glucosyltransferase